MDRLTIHPGRTLWEELAEQKIVLDRPCGGRGTCGRCEVVLRGGERVLACQYRTVGEVEIEEIPGLELSENDMARGGASRQFAAVGARGMAQTFYAPQPVAAVDIGTTTVVFTLFWRERSVTRSFVNPQRRCGADVMSRIRAANEGQGEELRRLLWERLEEELTQAWEELAGTNQERSDYERPACRLVISANTTMQHLLEGLSCERLGAAPFVPESLALRTFFIGRNAIVQLPGISAFVGADIVSGLFALDILHCRRPVLFVDLGTNGEMALGCAERLLVTSTAAGPAFEGSELAVRLHGAGLLRLLHELLEKGILDEYGTLCETYFDSGYPIETEQGSMVLTQENIRELQMAKAAVCAGVEMLLGAYGITAEQVEQVYLAGGFGYYLDPSDALAVGLLPEAFGGRITAVGNTSLEGAVQYLADERESAQRMEEICKKAEHISLPDCPGFEERYVERMNFRV